MRRLERLQKALAIERSFGSISQDWFTTQSPSWSESHTARQTRLLFKDLAALHASLIQQIVPQSFSGLGNRNGTPNPCICKRTEDATNQREKEVIAKKLYSSRVLTIDSGSK